MSAPTTGQWLPTVEELEAFLKECIKGQDHAITAVANQYAYFRSGFKDFNENNRRKPIGVFLFTGPSQVGKTELGRALGKLFYRTPDAITKINMETLNQPHFVSKLIGSPQGYIGYEDPPILSKERLWAKIPGLNQNALKSNDSFKPSAQPGEASATSRRDFLEEQKILLFLHKGNLEIALANFQLTLKEIELIEKSIDNYEQKIADIEKEEKNGKRSAVTERRKKTLRNWAESLKSRRHILCIKYLRWLEDQTNEEEAQSKTSNDENPDKSEDAAKEHEPDAVVPTQPTEDSDPVLVIILDEIEKAHPQIWTFFLQIFQEGVVQLANGQETNLRKAIFIMTSNLGANYASEVLRKKAKSLGFNPPELAMTDIKRVIQEEVEKTFSREFLNRIDARVTFKDLSPEDLRAILDMQLDEFVQGLEGKLIGLEITEEAKDFVIAKAREMPEEQAEGLNKQLKDLLIFPIQKFFLDRKLKPGQTITVSMKDGGLEFISRGPAPLAIVPTH